MIRFRENKLGFTLIELFVVMVIVVIMLAIILPQWNSIIRGGSVDSAARLIGSQLSLARQLSQSKSSYVALILPGYDDPSVPSSVIPDKQSFSGTGPSCSSPADLPDKYKFSTYRLAYVVPNSGSYEFSGWTEDSKWLFTPTGCTIMEADTDMGIQKDISGTIDWDREPEDNSSSRVNNIPFANPLVDPNDCDLVGDNIRAIIYAPNGKPIDNTYRFITIGEATPSWGMSYNWDTPKPNTDLSLSPNLSSSNQISLEINPFTGGVSYYTPEKY